MHLERLARFVLKPAAERHTTLRFFARKALSRLPFLPIRARLEIAPGEEVPFWWSYLPHENHPERKLSAYWGNDLAELRFLWRFLRPGMTFFDVGAYHGLFSVLAGMKLGSQGQVVAFEPSARERLRFGFHIQMNRLSRATLEPYAVSNSRGRQTMFIVDSDFSSMNSLQEPPINWSKRKRIVETIDLDSYLHERRIDRIDLMKIDVEGGEIKAFQGAQRLLDSIRPILICEVLDWVTTPWGYPAREIVSCLSGWDFQWFDFHSDGSLRPHVIRDSYPEIRNYLAVPREKVDLLARWYRS